MKAAFFTNSLSRAGGGLFHSVRLLAETVSCADYYDVRVFAPADPHLEQDQSSWDGLSTFTYPRYFVSRAEEALSQDMPDIIHLNGIWLPHSGMIRSFSRSRGIPVIISPRGMLDAWALRNAMLKKKIAGWLYEYRNLKSASCIHALCESEYQAVRAFGLKQPVAVIPNGVEPPPPAADREGLPWPYPEAWQEHPILLFLSRIHPKKGLIPLIHAWHRLAETGTDWRLAIVGPDESGHVKDVLALIEDYGLGSSVAWLGPKYGSDRDACYHYATAFVLPSYSEGFPMAALEALSFGLPTVLTPACHLPEAIDAGAALLTEPTEDGIAASLQDLFYLELSQLAAMGQKGRALASHSFTWESIAERMIRVYEWLAAPQTHAMPVDIRID